MSVSRKIRILAALLVLGALAAACGQKDGVHVGFAGSAGTAIGADGQPLALNSEGVPIAGGTGIDTDGDGSIDSYSTGTSGTTGTGTGTGSTSGGTTTGGTGTSSSGGPSSGDPSGDGGGGDGGGDDGGGDDGGGDSAPKPGTPGDSTGISASTIKIGVHAPLTGAAPIPQRSFEAGKDQYWNVVGEVYGRKIEVIFKDDKYNPSSASQVCQELILKEKVFILTGSGGTDQIAQCASIAAHYGVPYLSAGVTEVGLDNLPNYFAQSMTYSDQMPLLMQWIKKNSPPANKLVGIIASNTANFDDAVDAFEEQATKYGFTPKVYRPTKAPSDSELAALSSKIAQDGVTVGTPVMQPTAWIKMANNTQLANVQWAGIGVTMGLNSVANVTCPNADGAMFFSPFPGYNLATELDPRAKDAEDDIQWAQWGSNQSLHAIFKRMNGNLTREAFVDAMFGTLKPGIFNPTYHTKDNHFAVKTVHVLNLDCGKRQFVSSRSDLFKSGF